MHYECRDLLNYEYPVLRLLSILQYNYDDDPGRIEVESPLGCLLFKDVRLETQRGMLPLLAFHFTPKDGGDCLFYYWGTVSPWKFNRVEFCIPDCPRTTMVFNEISTVYAAPKSGFGYKSVTGGDEVQLACGSLYLWRSCCGLVKIFNDENKKYFNKMKTASRHIWEAVRIEKDGQDIYEEWKTEVNTAEIASVKIFLKNGIITSIES